jgi:nicotinate dehydrogenase subunit B
MNKEQFSQKSDYVGSAGRQLSRRDFLKLSGSGVFIFFTPAVFGALTPQQRGRSYPTDFNAYLKIGDDGRVSLYCSKIEMGQGIITSMAQMLAEELDVKLESIDMVMGDTMLCPWDGGTTGSRSTKYYGPPLRRAGAEARAILLQLASEELNIAPTRLVVKEGVVSDKMNASRKVTYSELVQGRQIERHLSDVPIKSISEHTVSGKPTKRTDARIKVTGEAKFAGDFALPGILFNLHGQGEKSSFMMHFDRRLWFKWNLA